MHADDFHNIIQTSIDAFLLVDLTGTIIETNDTYCRMVGYSSEQLIGSHISTVDAIENPEDVAARIANVIKGKPQRFETVHRHRDGSFIEIEASINSSE